LENQHLAIPWDFSIQVPVLVALMVANKVNTRQKEANFKALNLVWEYVNNDYFCAKFQRLNFLKRYNEEILER
jgi:hypothetical protein